jgi:hypothetical protein
MVHFDPEIGSWPRRGAGKGRQSKKIYRCAGCRSSAGAATSGSLLRFCCFFRVKPYKNCPDLPFERDFFVSAAKTGKVGMVLAYI